MLCNVRRRAVRGPAVVDLLEIQRVAVDGFLFEIADDAVGGLRAGEVEQEVGEVEYPLSGYDDEMLETGWLCHLDEDHQVHPFVFGFLEEGPDPAMIVGHVAQRA